MTRFRFVSHAFLTGPNTLVLPSNPPSIEPGNTVYNAMHEQEDRTGIWHCLECRLAGGVRSLFVSTDAFVGNPPIGEVPQQPERRPNSGTGVGAGRPQPWGP